MSLTIILSVAAAAAAPPIVAVVQAVGKPEEKVVVLSMGRNDRVRQGFEFTVTRDERFVGRVKVIKVYDELCGARVLFTGEGEAIRQGDKATLVLRSVAEEEPEETKARTEHARAADVTPGREHMLIARRMGSWSYRAKRWDAPGVSPSESSGTSVFRVIHGWLHCVETTEADGPALVTRIRGLGIAGYDNVKEKYFRTWIDATSSGITVFEGDATENEKEIRYCAEVPNLRRDGKQMMKVRAIEKHEDADHYSFEVHAPGPDGKEFKSFEIRYSRSR